jgi:hypothetical protein
LFVHVPDRAAPQVDLHKKCRIIYSHPLFHRDRPHDCFKIVRNKPYVAPHFQRATVQRTQVESQVESHHSHRSGASPPPPPALAPAPATAQVQEARGRRRAPAPARRGGRRQGGGADRAPRRRHRDQEEGPGGASGRL